MAPEMASWMGSVKGIPAVGKLVPWKDNSEVGLWDANLVYKMAVWRGNVMDAELEFLMASQMGARSAAAKDWWKDYL